jgi:hypothetical protein
MPPKAAWWKHFAKEGRTATCLIGMCHFCLANKQTLYFLGETDTSAQSVTDWPGEHTSSVEQQQLLGLVPVSFFTHQWADLPGRHRCSIYRANIHFYLPA